MASPVLLNVPYTHITCLVPKHFIKWKNFRPTISHLRFDWTGWFGHFFWIIMKSIDTYISMSQAGVNEVWWMNTTWHDKHAPYAVWVSELKLGESRALLPLTQLSDPTQQTSITAWHDAHTRTATLTRFYITFGVVSSLCVLTVSLLL
jgi:hypothetical protein